MCQEALGIIVISHLIHTLTMRSAVLAVLIVMVYVTSIAGLIARPQSRRLTSLKATSMKKPQQGAESESGVEGEQQKNAQKINISVAESNLIRLSAGETSNVTPSAQIVLESGEDDEVRELSGHHSVAWWKQRETVEQGLALLTLLLQNTGMIILMRLSRVKTGGPMYDIRTAVMMNEFLKLSVSALFYFWKENGSMADIRRKSPPMHLVKVMIPSALYVVQNNLQYVSLSNLPASVYQVLIQMKILTTAAVSEFLLGRKHNRQQWISLVSLFAGLSIVQASLSGSAAGATFVGNLTLGLIAVIISCLTSATAGVYFEKVVKGTPNVGLWAFNTQMSACSLFISLLSCVKLGAGGAGTAAAAATLSVSSLLAEVSRMSTMFSGFTPLVMTIVTLQAMGGLVVSLVVKKTNSVVKGFATSGAVVLSCLISRFLFHDFYGPVFYVGASIVTAAAAAFGQASPGLKDKPAAAAAAAT